MYLELESPRILYKRHLILKSAEEVLREEVKSAAVALTESDIYLGAERIRIYLWILTVSKVLSLMH